jgi:ribonuclease P protein component
VLYSFARGEEDDARPRFGVSVSRKVGNAVTRNRVKRTIREAVAELEQELPDGLDYVVLARPDAADLVDRDGMHGVKASLSELISPQPGGSGEVDEEPAGAPETGEDS